MRDEAAFLRDMLDSALRVQKQIAGKTYDEFLKDENFQDAVAFRLMVIGEAAKNISAATRATFPGLPFDDMTKMRNVMAHRYWIINHKLVWDTASNDLGELIKQIAARLATLGPPPGGSVIP